MSISEIVDSYMRWEEREKWLLLRDLAYRQLQSRFFSSPEKIDQSSHVDFRKYYLGFCTVSLKGFKYKLSIANISDFLNRYSVSELKGLIDSGNIQLIGNASWSQLHMGFRNNKWLDVKKAIKYLLFDERGNSVSEMKGHKVTERLGRVLENTMAVVGFGRAKVTPLLLICDKKLRFGVWNSVSDEALHELKLKRRTDITESRRVSEYLQANQALNKLKAEYGFKDLCDVDLFAWYFLRETRPQKPIKTRKVSSVISVEKPVEMFKEISVFEKEIRAFIFERLYDAFSDFWIIRAVPKEIGMRWQKRREGDIKEGKPPERNIISYADFSDYKEIMLYNWKNVFSKYFRDKEKLRVRLDDLNNLCRKTTMHARTLTDDEIGLGKVSIRWLRSRMKSIQ